MNQHRILLTFETEKEIKDLVDLVAQRAYTIDGVKHAGFEARRLESNEQVVQRVPANTHLDNIHSVVLKHKFTTALNNLNLDVQ